MRMRRIAVRPGRNRLMTHSASRNGRCSEYRPSGPDVARQRDRPASFGSGWAWFRARRHSEQAPGAPRMLARRTCGAVEAGWWAVAMPSLGCVPSSPCFARRRSGRRTRGPRSSAAPDRSRGVTAGGSTDRFARSVRSEGSRPQWMESGQLQQFCVVAQSPCRDVTEQHRATRRIKMRPIPCRWMCGVTEHYRSMRRIEIRPVRRRWMSGVAERYRSMRRIKMRPTWSR